ncbi:flagellar hook-associated protein 3 [Petrotoga mobilis SJ95]|uniref:Flagellar hook-associated protein 3 n=1 Tax=Petrotoga mobilis (strain DSM 10674 / SJ95) TaxID=403833 RepID=A9BF70_PETMO|nr:flagellar hook-associated protein FlgL [Petrotoga mobilis]ABX31134.1 flagellar hook-associated protein 3 [Petrotoga mobilis SJ95]
MRITENLLSSRTLNDIQDVLRKYSDLNSQLTSGKKVRYPSDNAAVATRISNLDSRLREIERYKTNVETAQNYVNMYDTALQEVSSIYLRVKELAVRGANDTLTKEDKVAISEELNKINTQLVSIANTEISGNYVFGGAKNNQKVVEIDSEGNFKIIMPPEANIRQKISVGGQDIEYGKTVYDAFVTDYGASIFAIVKRLSNAIEAGDYTSLQSEMENVEEIQNNVLKNLTEVGATQRVLEMTSNRMEEFKSFSTEFLSNEADADMAQVVMELATQQNVLQAALKAAGNIIPPTLADFL